MCSIHGEFYQVLNHHYSRMSGCDDCHKDKVHWTKRKLCKLAEEKGFTLLEFIDDKNIKLKCNTCGYEFTVIKKTLTKKRKTVCPECNKKRLRNKFAKPYKVFVEQAREIHGNRYYYFDHVDYVNNKTEIPIFCKKHGVFFQTPKSHLNGNGCKRCAEESSASGTELLFYSKVRGLIPDRHDIYRNVRKVLKNPFFEVDIYIPDFKLCLEFNGEYYHSTHRKYRTYHKNKIISALSVGLTLVHVYEHEFLGNADSVLTHIDKLLTGSNEPKYEKRVFVRADKDTGCWLANYGYLPIYWSEPVLRKGRQHYYWDSGIIVWEKYGGYQ